MSEVKQDAPFTVRWEYEVDGVGHQRLLEADQVHVAFDNRPPPRGEGRGTTLPAVKLGIYSVPKHGLVVLGNPHEGADSMALTFGQVYVMNREGKTVAKYKMADPDGITKISVGGQPSETLRELASKAGAN